MHRIPFIVVTGGVLLLSPLRAADGIDQSVAALGILPKDRGGQKIEGSEVNPFKTKIKEQTKFSVTEDTETQESKIRARFKELTVTGVRRDVDGQLMALVADMVLRVGEQVTPVLVDQTEKLTVSKISEKLVELTFLETKDSTQPRTILLPIRNKVVVRQKLGAAKDAKEFYTVGQRAEDAGTLAGLEASQSGLGSSGAASSVPEFVLPPAPAAEAAAVPKAMSVGLSSADAASAGTAPPAPAPAADSPADKPNRSAVLDQPAGPGLGLPSGDTKPTFNRRRPGPPVPAGQAGDAPKVQ